jgi:hypothetical protein
MNRVPLYLFYVVLTVVLCATSFRESLLNAPQQTSPNRSAGDVQRGKYLVEEVAKCETGVGPHGETLRPPMHTFHMHQDDARAIIAYLKTLTPEQR